MKYEVFNIHNPSKVIGVVEAPNKNEAHSHAQARYGKDCGVALIKQSMREGNILPRPIALREDAPAPQYFTFTLRNDLNESVTIQAGSREEVRERLNTLNKLAESFGLSCYAAMEFIRGREHGGSLEGSFLAMGYSKSFAKEAAKGRP
jgi:hypothetical protein